MISTLTVTPAGAAQAYARASGAGEAGGDVGQALGGQSPGGQGFGAVLSRALDGVVQAGHDADAQSVRAISGAGNLTEVATAVSRAELALQGAVAIRDKVVQAYQDIMRMPI